MKKIILIIALMAMSLQAEMRMAIATEGETFETNGVVYHYSIAPNEIISYERFITNTTGCVNFKVISMSERNHSYSKILIDCLDK